MAKYRRHRRHSKSDYYQDLIGKILKEQYARMTALVNTLPMDGIDLDKDTKESRTVKAVMAMEEEWILDPVTRSQLTMIDLQDPPDMV